MAGNRVLITGGAGLIGSHTADLLAHGYNGFRCDEIVVLDDFTRGTRANLEEVDKPCRITLVEGDIRDRDLVRRLMEGIDYVFHMAALRIVQCAAEPRLAHEVLVDGAFNVVEAAAEAKVKKMVAASSASIYGLAEDFPTLENHHPYNNRTIYGAAKVYNETLLRSFNEMTGLPYVALRYFNIYGPRMDIYGAYTEVFIRWMERIATGQKPVIFGNGTQTMDFIYAIDAARANVLAAMSDASDVSLNVASGTESNLLDLARALCKAMGTEYGVELQPERKVNPVPRRLASTEAARRLIGFSAEVGLDDGMEQLVSWWRRRKQSVPTEGAPA
ncbi:MAG: NAD-dependent epimerase/dehydratase family protein [Magnetospirillum sp.]|nr:NAD-dependent epimerase/dehydratase family protein [Magnetospirillum sp.]